MGSTTTGPLDNRREQVLGYVKTFADVIITWLWRHQNGENFTKKMQKMDIFKPICHPEESVLAKKFNILFKRKLSELSENLPEKSIISFRHQDIAR